MRNPIDHLTEGLPHGWRVTIDWLVTIVGAIAIVLAIKAWVVNPYRIPSSSMEPTLHCARPGSDCEARFSDRVLACRFCYRFWDPKRGDIVVFRTPPLADVRCGAGGTFVKRLIGLPGDVWEERNGYVYINGVRQDEPYIKPARRDVSHDRADQDPARALLHDGRQPQLVLRLAGVGERAAREPDRQGLRHLLATQQGHDPLMLGRAVIWLATLIGIAVVVLVVLGVLGILRLYSTPSASMEPTLKCAKPGPGCTASESDRVAVLKYVGFAPGRGDLVAFHTSPLATARCGAGGTFVKRIIAVPGDRVGEASGKIFVNGARIDDAYVPASERDSRSFPATAVTSGYFVLGDNRSSSCDSRVWGVVPRAAIVGKVVGIYWPWHRIARR